MPIHTFQEIEKKEKKVLFHVGIQIHQCHSVRSTLLVWCYGAKLPEIITGGF